MYMIYIFMYMSQDCIRAASTLVQLSKSPQGSLMILPKPQQRDTGSLMKSKILIAALMASSFLTAAAQTSLPDTPAARQFSAWLDAFNSGDRAALQKFLEKNFPARAAEINDEMGFRQPVQRETDFIGSRLPEK